jgi:hypothetical protein
MNFYFGPEMVQALTMRADSTESNIETIEREPRFVSGNKQGHSRRLNVIHNWVHSDTVAVVFLVLRCLL